jgi:hypothetical protein
MFRVIVAGSRDFDDYELMSERLSFFLTSKDPREVEIVSGGAKGADSLGEKFAAEHGITLKVFEADWALHGRAAGAIRNVAMAKYADALVAFWDGQSRGTAHMIKVARKRGLLVRVVQ